jgi:hypothetical protein
MAITALGSLGSTYGVTREILELRNQFDDLQRQLATGKRAETYGGLGNDRLTVLSLRDRVSAVEGFQSTVDQVQTRLNVVQQHLERIREVAAETRTDTLIPDFSLVGGSQTQVQLSAATNLNETLSLLNFELGGRYSFSGRTTETQPVVSDDVLLNGDFGRAGFRQVIDERRQADLGPAGLGRLTVANASPTVTLAEDGASHPFGFKLAAATSTLTGTVVTGPVGDPATLDVAFSATLPQAGETLQLSVDLPDGTQSTISLTATATAPAGAGEFLIGADETATASNFETALTASLQTAAARELSSASASAAADDFFFFDSANPPQRVDGPPFDSATALRDATTSDTVYWYAGDNGPGSARDSAIAHVDDNLDVTYGTRANETPFATVVSSLALLAAETYSETNPDDEARYSALTSRVASGLNFIGAQSVDDIITELGFKQRSIQQASERHFSAQQISLDLLQQKEGVDDYEVGTKLLRLQTTLQASFESTSLLSRLSLVNFL